MHYERDKLYRYFYAIAEFGEINGIFILGYYVRFGGLLNFKFNNPYVTLLTFSDFAWVAVAAVYKLYDSPTVPNPAGGRIRKSLMAYLSFVFLYFGFIVLSQGFSYSREFHLFFLLCVLVVVGFNSVLYSSALSFFAIRGRLSRSVLLVGAGVDGRRFIKATEAPVSGYKVVGVFDDDEKKAVHLNGLYLGKVSHMAEWLRGRDKSLKVDEIVVALPPAKMGVIQEVIRTAESHFLGVKLIPPLRNLYPGLSYRLEHLDGVPLMVRREDRMSYLHNRVLKRVLDIIVSLIALVFVFPFLYIASLVLIKLSSPGPVFFKQRRKGYRGDVFTCYKFRTMKVVPQELADEIQATPDDPRKTKVGDFYRRKNLDEFPQFINVLKGEMSVVGPRPHPIYLDQKYQDIVSSYNVRFFAKPGLTGWAQVNGHRGETKDAAAMKKRVEHDIWYIENWSLGLDIRIILLTILKMIKGDPNAY